MQPSSNPVPGMPGTVFTPKPIKRKIYSLSKSAVKAMGCEAHFAEYYLTKDPAARRVFSPLSDTGTTVHEYRREYVMHLVSKRLQSDHAWVDNWIATHALSDDARELIERDSVRFSIDPEIVLGTEIYMSVDENFEPLDYQENATYETRKKSDGVYVDGFLDLVLTSKSTAYAADLKTNWNTQNVDEYEGASYAAILFIHLPYVDHVAWRWDFVRSGGIKELEYTREDLPRLKDLIRNAHRQRDGIAEKFYAGKQLNVNPYAGLCSYCQINCPLRNDATSGKLVVGPIQSLEDAQLAASRIRAGQDAVAKLRDALRAWIDDHGEVPLPEGYVAELGVSADRSYPLKSVLAILGHELPDMSEKFGVPLDKLFIGTTKLKQYGKAKCRAGMLDALETVAKVEASSELKIRRRVAVEGEDSQS